MPRTYSFLINHFVTIAKDTIELGLSKKQNDFNFLPGQYVRINLETIKSDNPHDSYRELSIASSADSPVITTAFKVSNSPFKQQLLQLPFGSELVIEGPLGVFTLPKFNNRPIVMIAGGIGITPFMSMLRDKQYAHYQIRLIYFNNSPEHAAYAKELQVINKQQNRNIHFIYNSISPHTLANLSNKALYYIAGSEGMVKAARSVLESSGIMMNNIHTEEFTGY